MRNLIGALCLVVLCSPAFAADARKEPVDSQKAQEQRKKECTEKAAGVKNDERKGFISKCMSARAPVKPSTQQDKTAACNKDANAKNLKGDQRKAFMNSCLKG